MLLVRHMTAERSLRAEDGQVRLFVERHLFLKRRWQGVAEDGTEFDFDLESRLKHGCVIHQTGAVDYVIMQKPEAVIQIATPAAQQAALAGWRIGNLHFPVQILEGCIRVTADPVIRELVEQEKWPHEEVTVVFQPLKLPPQVTAAPPAPAL
jgi:urease accessory protein